MAPPRPHPGPKRPEGAPVGPDEVRRSLVEAAGRLFGERGVAAVSLRDVAAAADVHVALIVRYIGTRDDLLRAVLVDLSESVARDVVERPLEQMSFERDSPMGRWTVVLNYCTVARPDLLQSSEAFTPAVALAEVIMENYGLDEVAARLRGAQIVASALGWRLFETYLIESAGLDIDTSTLREELTALHRRLGATPWPSPPDPPVTA